MAIHETPLCPRAACALATAVLAACAAPDHASSGPEADDPHDIAFVTGRDGDFEVYLQPGVGGAPVNLTASPADEFWYCWAPDGERLAVVSDIGGDNDIWVIAADGTSLGNVTRDPASDKGPSWSPDGRTIAFHSTRDHPRGEIYTMDADGSNVRRLTMNEEYEECVTWSPDGARLAYCRLMPDGAEHGSGNGELYVMDGDGANVQRVTDRPGFDSNPAWSPDGTRLAFHGRDGDAVDLFVIDVDGTGLVNLTADSIEAWQPSWSPDGREIAYCAGVPPDEYDIWVIRADGGERRRITDAPGRDQSPSFRPRRR